MIKLAFSFLTLVNFLIPLPPSNLEANVVKIILAEVIIKTMIIIITALITTKYAKNYSINKRDRPLFLHP